MLLQVLLLLSSFASQAQPRSSVPDAPTRTHIQSVIDSLPQDGSLRRSLATGALGDGVHQTWMDRMRADGIKLATFEIAGTCGAKPAFKPEQVKRVIYRQAYDGPGSQIVDRDRLTRFQADGTEDQLRTAAFEKSRRAIGTWVDNPPKGIYTCFVTVDLYDDEWLTNIFDSTHNRPKISVYDSDKDPLTSAALFGDVKTVRQLLSARSYSKPALNTALFGAASNLSDNTDVISLLVTAGADVNAQRVRNETPLMATASFFNMTNSEFLLRAGAQVDKRDVYGRTAYDHVQRAIDLASSNKLSLPPYLPSLLKMLKGVPSA